MICLCSSCFPPSLRLEVGNECAAVLYLRLHGSIIVIGRNIGNLANRLRPYVLILTSLVPSLKALKLRCSIKLIPSIGSYSLGSELNRLYSCLEQLAWCMTLRCYTIRSVHSFLFQSILLLLRTLRIILFFDSMLLIAPAVLISIFYFVEQP